MLLHFQAGASSQKTALRSIEQFATRVRPLIEKALGPLDKLGIERVGSRLRGRSAPDLPGRRLRAGRRSSSPARWPRARWPGLRMCALGAEPGAPRDANPPPRPAPASGEGVGPACPSPA